MANEYEIIDNVVLESGENITITPIEEGDKTTYVISTTAKDNYNQLGNLPKINNVEIKGNMTPAALGIQKALQIGSGLILDDEGRLSVNTDGEISVIGYVAGEGILINAETHTISIDSSKVASSVEIEGAENGHVTVTKDPQTGKFIISADTYGTYNYGELNNKPKVNGHELIAGNNTLNTLGIQGTLTAGTGISIDNDTISASAVGLDYDDLSNKPAVDGKELDKDTEFDDLVSGSGAITVTNGNANDPAIIGLTTGNGLELTGSDSDTLSVKVKSGESVLVNSADGLSIDQTAIDYDNLTDKPTINGIGLASTTATADIFEGGEATTVSTDGTSNKISYDVNVDNSTIVIDSNSNAIKGNYQAGSNVNISGNTISATDTTYSAAANSKLTFTQVGDTDAYTIKEAEYVGTTNEVGVAWDSTNSRYQISLDAAAKSYTNLTDKPSINSVSLEGNKSLSDLGIQPTLVEGNGVTINSSTNEISVSTSYSDLSDKPQINGIDLSGNKSLSDLHILSGENVAISQRNADTIISATDTTYTAGAGISISGANNVIKQTAPVVRLIATASVLEQDGERSIVISQDSNSETFKLSKIFWTGTLTTDKNCKLGLLPTTTASEFVYMTDYVNGQATVEGTAEIYNTFGFTSAFKTGEVSGNDFLSAPHQHSYFEAIKIQCDDSTAKVWGTISIYGIDYLE